VDNLSGFIVSSPSWGSSDPNISGNLVLFSLPGFVYQASEALAAVTPSPLSRVAPQEYPASSYQGALLHAFLRDWYGRINVFGWDSSHTPPWLVNTLNLGSAYSSQLRYVEVWNAHLDASETLAGVNTVGADNMTISTDSTAGATFNPMESRLYSIVTGSIRTAGSNLIVFSVRANFRDSMIDSWEWLTDVITAYNGTEQRRCLRRFPRRTVEFSLFAHNSDAGLLGNLLWGWQDRMYGVPLWWDGSQLTQDAAASNTVLHLDTLDREIAPQQTLMLFASSSVFESVQVSQVFSDHVQLFSPLQSSWPRYTEVYPLKTGRLGADQSIANTVANLAEPRLMFRLLQSASPYSPVDYPTTYRSLPVLEDISDWTGGMDSKTSVKLVEYDNSLNNFLTDVQGAYPVTSRQVKWFLNTRGKIAAFKRWIAARQGRLTVFWMPSGVSDMQLLNTVQPTDSSIIISYIGYATHVQQQVGRRDVRIESKTKGVFYRRIVSSDALSSASESIQLDSALGVVISPDDIEMISFMAPSRLDVDRVEIDMRTESFAQATIMVRGVLHDS